MMAWIVRTSLRFRFIVAAVAAAVLILGFLALPQSKVDVFPEFAPPKVEVQTISLGLTSSEVEGLVTVPLEQALQGLPDLDVIRSKSVPQLSSIELLFKRGTDLLAARQLVQERMNTATAQLPTWAAPPVMIQPLSATSRVMKIGISSKSLSQIQMSTIAYWKIRARLLGVPGVANVPIWGEQLQQFQVQTDPEKLAANNVSLERVMTVTADALDAGLLRFSEGGFIGTGGWIESPNQRFNIHHKLAIQTPQDLAEVPIEGVTAADGSPLALGDVATVKIDHQPLVGDAVINGGPGLMLIVEKLPWANTLEVTRGVEAAINDLKPGLPGMEIDTTIFRPATFVELSIDNLTEALILGSILVVIVLALFLFSWRSALISLVTIPISLTASALVLHWRGTTINTMVLAGFVIAIGAVVDDAIVDTENIVRRLRQHRQRRGNPLHRAGDLRCVARSPRGSGVRVADRGARSAAGLLPHRAHRRVLPAARDVVRARRDRLDDGGADHHTGARADPVAQRAARPPRGVARRGGAPARLRADAPADRPHSDPRLRGRCSDRGDGHRGGSAPRPGAAAELQGT